MNDKHFSLTTTPTQTKNLSINQFVDAGRNHWNLNINLPEVPTSFENAIQANQQVSLEIVDGADLGDSNSDSSIVLIPLSVLAISRMDGKTTVIYQERYGSRDDSPIRGSILASIQLSDGENLKTDPFLQLTLSVKKQDAQNMADGSQTFGGTPEPYVQGDKGENAEGGVAIPLDQMQGREMHEGDRIVVPTT